MHEHVPVATVAEILDALPFPAEEHVKTLAFTAEGRVVLAALRGSDRLQFGRLARALGVGRDRISPLAPERVREELGLEPGGVCPLVDRDDVTVLFDRRVLDLPRAFCGSGATTPRSSSHPRISWRRAARPSQSSPRRGAGRVEPGPYTTPGQAALGCGRLRATEIP